MNQETCRIVDSATDEIRRIIGDPTALLGINGSMGRGYKLGTDQETGKVKDRMPYYQGGFDVDGFIVSDKLADLFEPRKDGKLPWRDAGEKFGEIKKIQQRVYKELREKLTAAGMKEDAFTFRVYTIAEMEERVRNNEKPKFVRDKIRWR